MNKIDVVLDILKKMHPFEKFEPTTELIESRLLTSLELFEMIAELESVFDIRINEEFIVADNFTTPEKIVEIVLSSVWGK